MSASKPDQTSPSDNDADELLRAEDAAEEVGQDDDYPMEDDDDDNDNDEGDDMQEEIQLQNDSAAHFDGHTDSIFCIAHHPLNPSLVVTGGGDDVAYLFESSLADAEPSPLLPTSYESNPQPKGERESISALQKLDGHTDSVNAVAFTQPSGEYIVTAGLDGKLRAWSSSPSPSSKPTYTFLSESSEVQEINWLSICPSPAHPNTLALVYYDGSFLFYTVNSTDSVSPLSITQAYYLHTESCTAGAWTPDGKLLATVSEDSSFHVHDVWGDAAAAGITSSGVGQAIMTLSASDQRFNVEGGLYSIAISPGGNIAAVGGAGGNIRIVGLPRLGASSQPTSTDSSTKDVSKNKTSGARKVGSTPTSSPSSSSATAGSGTLLASLQSQRDSVETLSFSSPPLTLLAAGSVDGSIALFDVAHRFALRRLIGDAHEGFAVVKVEFVGGGSGDGKGHYLTSAGMDGVVRRWDARGGSAGSVGAVVTTASATGAAQAATPAGGQQGLVHTHGSGGEEETIITAGDDGVALVFRAGLT